MRFQLFPFNKRLIISQKFNLDSFQSVILSWKYANELEFSTNKPGNISPWHSINNITFQDYINVNNAITKYLLSRLPSLSTVYLGRFIWEIVDVMMKTPPHQNLLLGNILLISPLILSAIRLKHKNPTKTKFKFNSFWNEVKKTILRTTEQDTILVAEAIKHANPGGLIKPGGKEVPERFNILNPEFSAYVKKHKIHLIDLFQKSMNYDLISGEWVSGYHICQYWLKNYFYSIYNDTLKKRRCKNEINLNTSFIIQQLSIKFLATYPDSLILRKNSSIIAENVQKRAQEIIHEGGLLSESGKILYQNFSQWLNSSNGKLNPGTTADFIAVLLFLAHLIGWLPS
ncbi:triphosphoribosyl-dephospho-CoA synthase [Candidatus Harpocratesius sp.]